jgi:hypothetical protein
MYQAEQPAEPQGEATQQGENKPPSDEDVVDGEFKNA